MKLTSRVFAASLILALPNTALVSALAAEDKTEAASTEAVEDAAEPAPAPDFAFETSDVTVDSAYTFGKLENGMRYILRKNGTPEGTAMIRMRIDSGSLVEEDSERGLAHYLEHMAFNGSKGIPEGEMIKLLEREGLAFGGDTNASTGLEAITYMLNLPRNDEDLLDTALMIMRETASELTLAEDAVERERGVILAEERERRSFAMRAQEDSFAFIAPGARFAERLPIGTIEVIEGANSAQIRALYERTYTPANTIMVIVGDIDVAVMEAKLRERFADWKGKPAPVDGPAGPIDITRAGETDIYTDPALSESVSVFALGKWQDEPDTIANRDQEMLRSIGYGIINRRLARLARAADAPYRGAGFGSGDFFEDARITDLNIASVDGEWRKGLLAAVREVNQAMTYGFTQAEVDEQLARRRTGVENAVKSADTRTNGVFVNAALRLISDDAIPTTPEYRLAAFERMAPNVTPESVFAALKAHAVAYTDPLIRFQGRTAPEGGEAALRSAFTEAMALPISAPVETGKVEFAYTDFGAAGEVVADTTEEALGIRTITFANGVRLNLKKTDIREDRISASVRVDGGSLMASKEDPLAVNLAGSLSAGGLGSHTQDEMSTILAGRQVGFGFGAGAEQFSMGSTTTPRDLELQLQVMAATLTDPGYRREGVERFRKGIDNFFETIKSTPSRALGARLGAELSDNDPRFSLQDREAYFALNFEDLKANISDRLANGAIEVALVGDLDEEAAIAAVAKTLGALPKREADFLPRSEARKRSFTSDRSVRTISHDGEGDKALLRMVWPARDDSDFEEMVKLQVLSRILRLEITDRIREELGQAYAPSAGMSLSSVYPGYGTINLNVALETDQVEAARAAVAKMLADFTGDGITEDLIERARKPLLERHDNALKSLGGWMGLVRRAQSKPDRIERFQAYTETLNAVSLEDVKAMAAQYLKPEAAVTFLVMPSEEAKAKTEAAKAQADAETESETADASE